MNEEPEEPYVNCIQQMGIYETRAVSSHLSILLFDLTSY